MPFDFPTNPASGSSITNPTSGLTYTWNGSYWTGLPVISPTTTWTKPLNNVAGGIANWTTTFTGTGRPTLITATVTAFRNPGGAAGTINLLRNGVVVATVSKYFNNADQNTMPTLMYLNPNETGTNTYSISLGASMSADANSFCTMTIQEF